MVRVTSKETEGRTQICLRELRGSAEYMQKVYTYSEGLMHI